MAFKATNFVLYYAAWFACVLGAAHGRPALGVVVTLATIAIHLAIVRDRPLELRLILCAALIGFALDSALVISGLLRFPPQAHLGGPSPMWMVSLWASFGTILNGCVAWLKDRFILAATLGAVGGPLAYLAGQRLGALQIGPATRMALLAIAVEWTVSMLLLIWLNRSPIRTPAPIVEAVV